MRRSSFLFFKGLGLLFAILCGIGTAVLGWFDGADWMNIAAYSIAVTGLILWGWYHFSVRWINEDLKQNIFTKFPKEQNIQDEENEEDEYLQNYFAKIRNKPLEATVNSGIPIEPEKKYKSVMNISTLMIMMSLPVVRLAKKFMVNSFRNRGAASK